MATARDIVTRALRRLAIIDSVGVSASAEDVSDGLDALNEMIDGWALQGVDVKHREVFASGFGLNDTFWFFVPPADVDAQTILSMEYAGTWNATTNSPALASSDGTQGQFYRVATAGSTELDDIDSWSVDDALIYGIQNHRTARFNIETLGGTGYKWMKARSSRGLEGSVVALLAQRLAEDYGASMGPVLANDARRGWSMIQAAYIVPGVPTYDAGIVYTPTRSRWVI